MRTVDVYWIMIVSILSGTLVGTSLIFDEQNKENLLEIERLELMVESCQKAVETCVDIYNEVKP